LIFSCRQAIPAENILEIDDFWQYILYIDRRSLSKPGEAVSLAAAL
jgi:hypothetical protein